MPSTTVPKGVVSAVRKVLKRAAKRGSWGCLYTWTQKGAIHATDGHCAVSYRNGAEVPDGLRHDFDLLPGPRECTLDLDTGQATVGNARIDLGVVDPPEPPDLYGVVPAMDPGYKPKPTDRTVCFDADVLRRILDAFEGGTDHGGVKLILPEGGLDAFTLYQKRDGRHVRACMVPCREVD